MITWQPAPASTWQLCEGQRIIGSVTLGIDGLWRWRRALEAHEAALWGEGEAKEKMG